MDNTDIIQHVENFYNSAWDKLIIVGSIALGIVGIIAPIIIQWYQKRTLKLSEEKLREILRKEIEESKNQLKEEIELLVNKRTKKVKRTLNRRTKILNCNSEGGLYYLQGNGQLDNKEYFDATRSYAMAIDYYRSARNFIAIQDLLPNLTDCLDKIKKTDIEKLKKEHIDLDLILTKILNKDKNGTVRNIILDDIYRRYNYFANMETK